MRNQLSHPGAELRGTVEPSLPLSPARRPPAGRPCRTAAPTPCRAPTASSPGRPSPACNHLTAGLSTPGADEPGPVQAGGRDGEGGRHRPGVSEENDGSASASARRSPARLACAGAAAPRRNMAAGPRPAPRGAAAAPSPLGLSARTGLALLPPRPSPRRSAGKKLPLPWGLRPCRPLAELRPRHLASGRGAARLGSARPAGGARRIPGARRRGSPGEP